MTRPVLHSPLDAMLLALLRAEPGHGYALIGRLREASGGAFDLPEGTIYPALQKLEAEGEVMSDWRPAGGRRRRVYWLSERGRAALETGQARWRRYKAAVDAVIAT